jgi:hypothetical protein
MPKTITDNTVVNASFRDPSGFVFWHDAVIYRQINHSYRKQYEHLIASGLYERLVTGGLLVRHNEVDLTLAPTDDAYRVIQPDFIAMITYPYEWCFTQLKDAALATLKLQRIALKHGMILKDASAYNIQFIKGKPVLIDTLSFEIYQDGQVWDAYRQFCQHFLAPLALMSYKDIRLGALSRLYIDGVSLDLATSLLPKRSWLKLGIALHLHLHSRAQTRSVGQKQGQPPSHSMSQKSLLHISDRLEQVIRS